jgi:hypothetical protein
MPRFAQAEAKPTQNEASNNQRARRRDLRDNKEKFFIQLNLRGNEQTLRPPRPGA